MFLQISQNSQETSVPEPLFNKTTCLRPATLLKRRLWPEACNFFKKETLAQVFSCEFCVISKNTFFHGTPLEVVSERFIREYTFVKPIFLVKHIPDFDSLQLSQKTQFQNILTYQMFRAIFSPLKLIVFTVHIFLIRTFSLYQTKIIFAFMKRIDVDHFYHYTSLNIYWLASFSSFKLLIGLFEFNKKTPWNSLLLKLFLTSACY